MTSVQQIAKHFREVYFGNNWTDVNLKDTLADITWQQATTKIYELNTIAALVFHVNYYIKPVSRVLQGQPLQASDKLSFDLPPISSDSDWKELISRVFEEAEFFAAQIEQMDEAALYTNFADPKYGTYYRNLFGIIEHTYYHLGQISLIKKILNEKNTGNTHPQNNTV